MKFLNANKISIKTRLLTIFLVIAVIMTMAFYISLSMRSKIDQQYHRNMHVNMTLNKLSMAISQSHDDFERYALTGDVKSYTSYIKNNYQIYNILESIGLYIKEDTRSSVFLRHIENMFEYRKTLAYEIDRNKIFDETVYNNRKKFKKVSEYMNTYSQKLIKRYLTYSGEKYTKLMGKYKFIEKQIYLVVIFFAIISVFFAMMLSNNILKTIIDLSNNARLLSMAKWDTPDIKENKYYELNILAKAFNNMKKDIKKFIEELKYKAQLEKNLNEERLKSIEKDKLLKESQLMALQMQMDPHFLFNALNTVSRTAMFEGGDKTVKLIHAISKMLRSNLNFTGELISLTEEISVLKAYISIQEIRFEDQMKFILETNTDMDAIKVPPMIIQPIVENSIKHGLKNKEKGGIITVKIHKRERFLDIIVADNGEGMHKESINTKDSSGVGLSNVKERLKLYYGKDDLLRIDSKVNYGTKVTISIPLWGDDDSV